MTGKKDFRDEPSEPMWEKDILPPHYGEDEEKATKDHEEDKRGEGETEDHWEGGVNISQPNDRNVPKEKDEKQQNDTGKGQ